MCMMPLPTRKTQLRASSRLQLPSRVGRVTGAQRTVDVTAYNHTNTAPPAARFASRFQVAWITAAERTRASAVNCTLASYGKRSEHTLRACASTPSSVLGSGCWRVCPRYVALGPTLQAQWNPSHHSMTRRQYHRRDGRDAAGVSPTAGTGYNRGFRTRVRSSL